MDFQQQREWLIYLLNKSEEGSDMESFILNKLHILDSQVNAPKYYRTPQGEREYDAEIGIPYNPRNFKDADTNITPYITPMPKVEIPSYKPNPMKTYDEGIYQNPYQKQPVNTIWNYRYGREPDMQDIRRGITSIPTKRLTQMDIDYLNKQSKTRGIGNI